MFVIDVMSRTPVYEQIIGQVKEWVLTGILKEGDKLPSVRGLSVKLSINPNTIQKAYTELDRTGIIITVPGKGSFIAPEAVKIVSANSREKTDELVSIVKELAYANVSLDELIKLVTDAYNEVE
ncbi:MAG: GntR family transcriptional regulator [Lachnospira sp.]